jgi:hypothetical protein
MSRHREAPESPILVATGFDRASMCLTNAAHIATRRGFSCADRTEAPQAARR